MTRRFGLIFGACMALLPGVAAASPPSVTTLRGQTATLMPDGTWLLLGGRGPNGPVAAAAVRDSATSEVRPLANGLLHARAGHTATLLPDGRVLIFGGWRTSGWLEDTAELYDPVTHQFRDLPPVGLPARARHTATLLTDGRILVAGGVSETGEALSSLLVWDVRSNSVASLRPLVEARRDHTAILLSDGSVLLWGGLGANGLALDYGENLDPLSDRTSIETAAPAPPASLSVEASLPPDGAQNVPLEAFISLRLSRPVLVTSASTQTITLSNPEGPVGVRVVPAEGGRLIFITPRSPLLPGTEYTVSLSGVTDGADRLEETTVSFTTAAGAHDAKSDDEPEDTGRAAFHSPWRKLPPLQAAPGVTGVAGQVLRLNGQPLEQVTLSIGVRATRTDATGRFLLTEVESGHQVMLIDGRTASRGGQVFGVYEVGVDVAAHKTNALGYTIWMTRIDLAHAVTIPSPTSAQDTVITTPRLPGVALHLPARTVIRDHDGNVVHEVSITPIPLDKPPFPLPAGIQVPLYFTIQPGAGYIDVQGGGYAGGRLFYPNAGNSPPGTVHDFWNYDADSRGWYVYGQGRVSPDRQSIVPDPGVEIHELTGAMVAPPPQAPATGPGCTTGGDPVDLGTGLFIYQKTDLSLTDVIPISLTRTYRQSDSYSRAFGRGMTHPYDIFLIGDRDPYTYQQLILEDGKRVHYVRTSPGTGYLDAVYQSTMMPGRYFGSTIVWDGGTHWVLTLKDGTVYTFLGGFDITRPQGAGLIEIRDRFGNRVTITRGSDLNVSQITSPNGRWMAFTYDTSNRVTQVRDNIGRTVSYVYDAGGRLQTMTDAASGVTSYTYDLNNSMLTVTDPRNHVHVTNEYDANNRVSRQTLADNAIYEFSYTTDSNGNVTQTSMTDPNAKVTRASFNAPPSFANGFKTSGCASAIIRALGATEEQTSSSVWQTGTNLLTSETDGLGHTTAYTYDSLGNTTSITRLSGTPDATTTRFAYGTAFSRLASITDPLNHVTSFTYDAYGNMTAMTDALGHQRTFSYNSAGQPLTACDALNHCSQYGYDGGDLVSVTDTLGRTTSLFRDGAGRPISSTNALGQTTRFAYDLLDRRTSITDARGGQTSFTYDANGNLLTVTDANNHTTQHTYDDMDRLATRTDPLLYQEGYQYDGNGNLTQHTDRRGKVTTYGYDGLNRLTFVGFDTQPGPTYESTVSYSYDAGDRLTQAVDSISGTVTRGYDDLDRLTSETTPAGTVSYTYDAAGRRLTMSVPNQSQVSYTYDAADRLTQVTQSSAAVQLSYDDADRRTALTLPNGIVTGHTYNDASELTQITYTSGQTTLGTLTYSYDLNGNRVTVGGSFARTGLPSAVATAAHNAANQLTTWGTSSLTYDANGNLTSDGTHSYTWSARNALAAIDSGSTAAFVYDAFGRRRSKTMGGGTTSFVYDGPNVVQEVLSSGAGNSLMSLDIDEVFQRTDAAGARIFLTDALGSTVALADSTATIQTQYTYEPFGQATVSGTGTTFSFTGRELDATGLYYYRARYYNPKAGRFISEDPIGFRGGINFYPYVNNNPANLVDPSGLLVELYCVEVGRGSNNPFHRAAGNLGYKHCFLRVKCDCSQQGGPYDFRLEATGRNPNGTAAIPNPQPFVPGGGTGAGLRNPDSDSMECQQESCLLLMYRAAQRRGYPYPKSGFVYGPNSNTFINDLLAACGNAPMFPPGVPPFTE